MQQVHHDDVMSILPADVSHCSIKTLVQPWNSLFDSQCGLPVTNWVAIIPPAHLKLPFAVRGVCVSWGTQTNEPTSNKPSSLGPLLQYSRLIYLQQRHDTAEPATPVSAAAVEFGVGKGPSLEYILRLAATINGVAGTLAPFWRQGDAFHLLLGRWAIVEPPIP